jgi:hypothetical protein
MKEKLRGKAATLVDRASDLADRVEALPAEVARRVTPKPKRRRGLIVVALLIGAACGYAAAFFGDREQGRARRAEAARRLEAMRQEAANAPQVGAIEAAVRKVMGAAEGQGGRIPAGVALSTDDGDGATS